MPAPAVLPPLPDTLRAVLRQSFGFEGLRSGQGEALAHLVAGRDTLVVMPTGAGKSLVYQLAAFAFPGLTLVVSPLIALMKDQVDGLSAKGIPVAALHSAQTAAEQQAALTAVARGTVKLVYVAPERLRSRRFLAALDATPVSLLAVDEAHCISQWGHDFRPDYLALGHLRADLGHPLTVALTATATPEVQDDIVKNLAMPEAARVVTGFDRPNLLFEVRATPGDADKRAALRAVADAHKGAAGLVYASTRAHAERVMRFLRDDVGLRCDVYHAGLGDRERTAVQDAYMGKALDVVVATNAFGMGVDRADVRFVVHWNLPPTLEAYYQEAGRAGRDGQPATATLLYAPTDRQLRAWLIDQHAPDGPTLRRLHQALDSLVEGEVARVEEEALARTLNLHDVTVRIGTSLLERMGVLERYEDEGPWRVWGVLPWTDAAAERVLASTERRRTRKHAELDRMVAYAETETCRRRLLLDHFGDDTSTDHARCCDACTTRADLARETPTGDKPAYTDLPMPARIALGLLDLVQKQRWPLGRKTLVRIVTGSKAEGMEKYTRHPYFGKLSFLAQDEADRLFKYLITSGYLKVGGEYQTVELTARGAHALEHRLVIALPMRDVPTHPGAPRPVVSDGPIAAKDLLPEDRPLFEQLRSWRMATARSLDVPPYVVFSDATLLAIAAARPQTEAALLALRGIGPAKIQAYGDAVLKLVAQAGV